MLISTSQMLGKELVCSSVTTIARTLHTTLTGLVHFLYHEDVFAHILDDIRELNLETDVSLIEAIVEDLEVHIPTAHGHRHRQRKQRRSLELSLRHLHHSLDEIHQALQNFRSQMEAHRHLWFSYYRSFDTASHLRLLRLCKRRLDHHFDRLVKVHQLFVPAPAPAPLFKMD